MNKYTAVDETAGSGGGAGAYSDLGSGQPRLQVYLGIVRICQADLQLCDPLLERTLLFSSIGQLGLRVDQAFVKFFLRRCRK